MNELAVKYFAVAVGGAAGAVGRFMMQTMLNQAYLPWGTLICNVSGSLLAGIIAGGLYKSLPVVWSTGLVVGFLGAFTTMSSFAVESSQILQQGRLEAGIIYVAITTILSIVAAYWGFWLFR